MIPLTAAHITHEACEKIGGIGTVLEGLITSPVYQKHVKRSILVGPFASNLERPPHQRAGCDGHVLYSTVDQIDELALHGKFRPIEAAFNVNIVYGRREFSLPGSEDHAGSAEILLIDVFNINTQHVNQFKKRLWDVFGIDSTRYESDWAYEEYVRLAEPAFYALLALLQDDELPSLLFSHEFMGLPTAFKATLDGQRQFRTVFHAHECATARRMVEDHPGHDTSFYNILDQARMRKLYVEDVFGDQSRLFRHALISKAHCCDAIIAVGEFTAKEMHFLGSHFDHHHIDLVHNGVPHLDADIDQVTRCRRMLLDYSGRLLGWRPDVLMTHVMRPVISKGVWRDMQVCHELDWRFSQVNRRGVLFILTSAGGTRRPQDVASMKAEYGWPRQHREGYPDLVGPEVGFNQMVEQFNATHRNIQVVLVNQFGWSQELIGDDLPAAMTFGDLRRATDIEFGMAVYEPFGISPLEPLGSGAVCVISSVCGCKGFVDEATGGVEIPNVIAADFTRLDRPWSIEELMRMTQADRDAIEQQVAARVAEQLTARLNGGETSRRALLESGRRLVHSLGWDHVIENKLIPMLHRVMSDTRDGRSAVARPDVSPART